MAVVCALGYKQAAASLTVRLRRTVTLALRARAPTKRTHQPNKPKRQKRGGRAFALTRLQIARPSRTLFFWRFRDVSVYRFCFFQNARRYLAQLFSVFIYLKIIEKNIFFIVLFPQFRHDIRIINIRFYKCPQPF